MKLHLSPQTAGTVVFAIFAGSLVNIPIRRIARTDVMAFDPMAVFGLYGWWPEMRRVRTDTTVAVNVGGCVIPVGLAIYEIVSLAPQSGALVAMDAAAGVNIAVCYRLAKPVEGVGIMMPAMIPAAVACAMAIMLAPAIATPVAFIAGVAGPLIGADLLHLRDVERIASGMVSIGGAGTFDGILLTGILALYLA